MKKDENPLKRITGRFEGKMDKSSTELVREMREESEARIRKLEKGTRV